MLGEYNQDGCFPIRAHNTDLATIGQRNQKTKLARDVVLVATAITTTQTESKVSSLASDTIVIDPCLEHIMPNRVTIYRNPEVADSLAHLLNEHQDLFQDQGQTIDILEEEQMLIPLKLNITSRPSKVYLVK